jgi:NADPH:quinone reductase-like Zn-dependent oxidoreductase
MKAMVWTRYGPPEVLQLREVEKPVPKDNEVLVKIRATTVMVGDCELRRFHFSPFIAIPLRFLIGLRKPTRVTILGQELAGDVEATGSSVTTFKAGQPVIAATMLRLSSYAEYICLPQSYLVAKPAFLSYSLAATLPTGGIYGLHLVQSSHLQHGQNLLLVGAGGTIGTYALQIAKAFGAHVTAVDSTPKLDLLRSLGADQVIDYTSGNYLADTDRYAAIIDVVGKSPYSACLKALVSGGRYVLGNPGMLARLRAAWTSNTSGKLVITDTAVHSANGYAALLELIEAGKLVPFIDRTYPLEQLVEAHRYVESGQKQGCVVITVD